MRRKIIALLMAALFLTGCGAGREQETISGDTCR